MSRKMWIYMDNAAENWGARRLNRAIWSGFLPRPNWFAKMMAIASARWVRYFCKSMGPFCKQCPFYAKPDGKDRLHHCKVGGFSSAPCYWDFK